MRVHAIQVSYGDGEPVAARVQRVAALVAGQRGADLVVLPELWSPTGFGYRNWKAAAETLDGLTVRAIAGAARSIGAWVHAGSIIERPPDGAAPDAFGAEGRGLWNTSVLLAPDGSVASAYRKIHRFGFAGGEPSLLEAGRDVVTQPMRTTRGTATLGLATCYDLRFPEQFRLLLDAGATVLVIPAAWPMARVGHWTLLGRARAVENQCFVVQCNTAGTHAGVAMGGRSQIVAPTGDVIAEAGDGEQVLIAELDLEALTALRADFPVLADRRL